MVSASEEAAGCWGADGVGAIGGRRGNVCPAGEEEEDGGPLVQPPYFFPPCDGANELGELPEGLYAVCSRAGGCMHRVQHVVFAECFEGVCTTRDSFPENAKVFSFWRRKTSNFLKQTPPSAFWRNVKPPCNPELGPPRAPSVPLVQRQCCASAPEKLSHQKSLGRDESANIQQRSPKDPAGNHLFVARGGHCDRGKWDEP